MNLILTVKLKLLSNIEMAWYGSSTTNLCQTRIFMIVTVYVCILCFIKNMTGTEKVSIFTSTGICNIHVHHTTPKVIGALTFQQRMMLEYAQLI